MTIATDLQDINADISAAIAGRKTWGRIELEQLRRSLAEVAREARKTERAETRVRNALDEVCTGIDHGIINLAGLAKHARGTAQLAEAR